MNKYMNLQKQLIVTVEQDDCDWSPREWGGLSTFYTWERDLYSPDNHNYSDALEFLGELLGETLVDKIYNQYNDTGSFMDDITKRLDKLGYILYPISKYEHSGVIYSIGVSSGWDSGVVGVIFAEKKKICNYFNVKKVTQKVRKNVVEQFENEIELYNRYVNGDVYYIHIENFKGETCDSLSGIYEDIYNTETMYNFVNENLDEFIGEISEWKEFDQEEIDEKFLIETVTTVTPR